MLNFVEIAQTAAEISRFFDFKDGGRRHLGFSVEVRQHAKFRRNRLNRGRDMAIFRFWILKISKFLTVVTVKKVELHHYAKFHRNRSKCGRDMLFLDFSRWRSPPS